MRGMGIAKAMVERLIADARSEGFKIFALCPYVRSQFDRHPEWRERVVLLPDVNLLIYAHRAESLAMFRTSVGDGKEGVRAFLEKRAPKFRGA